MGQRKQSANLRRQRAELNAILRSGVFDRAPLLSKFLSFVCEKAFAGEADQIKEYSIATEALGRPESFDHTRDSIVRVEAHRLRKRLRQFYEGPGANHDLQIEIPSGQYAPSFVPRPDTLEATGPPGPVVASESGGNPKRPVALMALAVVCAVALAIMIWRVAVVDPHETDSAEAASIVPEADAVIRISPGVVRGRIVEPTGRIWERDQFFIGGEAVQTPAPPELSGLPERLFSSARFGNFEYAVPLPPGYYDVRLYFADNGPSPAKNFNVTANGDPLLEHFDLAGNAGGRGSVDVRVFAGLSPASDGQLHLRFSRGSGILHGLEILRGREGSMLPLRILAGQNAARHDAFDRFWSEDQFYRGGKSTNRRVRVSGTDDPGRFRGERYGQFIYVLPAAEGRYTLRLSFAETWHGSGTPEGGEGSRVFHVICNGKEILRDFDIYREAGGPNRAVVKEFRGIEANAQGNVAVRFVPVVENACVNAIELIPET